jgi:hypothetical protein
MKISRSKALIISGFLILGSGYVWLAFGLFSDREFGDIYLFQKYKFSTHFYFHAPLGESDNSMTSLSSADQQAEAEFHDFVEVHEGYSHKFGILR